MGGQFGSSSSMIRLPPYNPDLLFQQRGYQLFDEMETLAAVAGPVNLKREATLYKGWDLVPAIKSEREDKRYAIAKEIRDECYRILTGIGTDWDVTQAFRDALWEVTDGYFRGWRYLEIIWKEIKGGPDTGKLGLKRIRGLPNKQVGFNLDKETDIPVSVNSQPEGGPTRFHIPIENGIHYVYRPRNGLPWGMPDGRAVFPSWWSLKAGFKFWAIGLEQFGTPFILAKAPKGQVFSTVQRALADIRQGAPGVLPMGIEADLIAAGAGGLQSYEAFVAKHEAQVARVVLGQESTTQRGASAGSHAADQVRENTQEFFLGGARASVEECVNQQLLRRMVRYNRGPGFVDLAPRLSLGIWDQTDRLKLAQALGLFLDRHAVHRSNPHIMKEFGFPPISDAEQALLDTEAERAFQAGIKPSPAGPTTDGGPMNGQ